MLNIEEIKNTTYNQLRRKVYQIISKQIEPSIARSAAVGKYTTYVKIEKYLHKYVKEEMEKYYKNTLNISSYFSPHDTYDYMLFNWEEK